VGCNSAPMPTDAVDAFDGPLASVPRKGTFLHLQRVLAGLTPDQVVAERLTTKPALAKAKPSGRAGPCDITKAHLIAESAEEVLQPDMLISRATRLGGLSLCLPHPVH
jgi:hypothetical protein